MHLNKLAPFMSAIVQKDFFLTRLGKLIYIYSLAIAFLDIKLTHGRTMGLHVFIIFPIESFVWSAGTHACIKLILAHVAKVSFEYILLFSMRVEGTGFILNV